MPEQIVIFGAGGHAKVVVDAIELEGRHVIAFVADADAGLHGTTLQGYRVRSEAEGFAAPACGVAHAFVAIGRNEVRQRIANMATGCGLVLARVVHPAATVARSAALGAGTLVMPGCVVNADARIGTNVIINTGAIIEHDCRVGDGTHIAPRVTLCGGVRIGAGTLVGAGAVILPGVKVGAGATVGAGALVMSDVPDEATIFGVPARVS
ncbi:MAG: acetyltransferase [Sulfuritalea sp.]|nr:acetyltransferase [Sulfuritalea sp.]